MGLSKGVEHIHSLFYYITEQFHALCLTELPFFQNITAFIYSFHNFVSRDCNPDIIFQSRDFGIEIVNPRINTEMERHVKEPMSTAQITYQTVHCSIYIYI